VKQLTYVPLADRAPVAPGAADVLVVAKTVIRDLIPDLASPNGYMLDKIESLPSTPTATPSSSPTMTASTITPARRC
jgi:hypothetical protein